MELNIYPAPPLIVEKINCLCNLLRRDKMRYEQVSATIPDKALRRTILSLAQSTNQYACELLSQIQTLGWSMQEDDQEHEPETTVAHLEHETDILNFCETQEKKLVKAYRDILNESYLYDGLRKLIRYQLNGILCAFTQLKLLNSVRLH